MGIPLAARRALLSCTAAIVLTLASGCGFGGDENRATIPDSLGNRLDEIVETTRTDFKAPALSAALIQDGTVVWSEALGSRWVGGPGQIGDSTPFIAASTAKTVTAAMVLRLVDEGKVELDDPVSRYLGGLPGADRIFIFDLLRHTSGLPDYLYSPAIDRVMRTEPGHPWTREEVLDRVNWLDFEPGSRFEYSNTNFVALGGVIEQAGDGQVQPLFEELLADPLGLEVSDWSYGGLPKEDLVRPYLETPWSRTDGFHRAAWPGREVPTDFWGEVWTDGGLATTSEELGLIANGMIAGDLLEPETRRRALRIGMGASGLGLFTQWAVGKRWFGHDGLYDGFTSQHWTDPATGITIAVMTSLETFSGPDVSAETWSRLARAVARSGLS
jgi:D-alanyl-D-alanine carboxypeptidase